MGTRSFPG